MHCAGKSRLQVAVDVFQPAHLLGTQEAVLPNENTWRLCNIARPKAKRRKSKNRRWSARCSVLLDKNPEPSWQGIVVLSTEEVNVQALLINERLYIFTRRWK